MTNTEHTIDLNATAKTWLAAAVTSVLAVAAVILFTTLPPQPAQLAPPPASHEQPFLPLYLDYLTGKKPWPKDVCQPRNLEELLIPCDH